MVVRANKKFPELGGHIGTFASAATLYDVGMNHFGELKIINLEVILFIFKDIVPLGCMQELFLREDLMKNS